MQIKSAVFTNNGQIPPKYTCAGENINPPLDFVNIPENTKSLLLIVDDPDSTAGAWVHWIVYNIDPSIRTIEENSTPAGSTEAMTTFGKPGYSGPCPPSGNHRYFFKLYALDTKLTVDEKATKESLLYESEGHMLDQTSIIGLYQK